MNIIKIGEPLITKKGTVITKYVENGRLFKSIDFMNSANKCAKEKGLVKTVVRYGDGNRPETIYDTFERQIVKAETKPTESVEPPKSKRGRKKGTTSTVSAPKKVSTKGKQPDKTVAPEKETPKGNLDKPEKVVTNPAENIKPDVSEELSNPNLIPISTDAFTRESAKKLHAKINQYVKLAGKTGTFDDAIIMKEKENANHGYFGAFCGDANIYLSLNKENNEMRLNLSRKTNRGRKKYVLFNALFNQEGQMIDGKFPLERISFKRDKNNIRRLKQNEHTYLPVGENDREWSYAGSLISGNCKDNLWYAGREDNAVGGAFEVFMEFARLHTSIFK